MYRVIDHQRFADHVQFQQYHVEPTRPIVENDEPERADQCRDRDWQHHQKLQRAMAEEPAAQKKRERQAEQD